MIYSKRKWREKDDNLTKQYNQNEHRPKNCLNIYEIIATGCIYDHSINPPNVTWMNGVIF